MTLALSVLGSVTGGKQPPAHRATAHPAPNRTTVNTNVGFAGRGMRVGVQADVDIQRTDYAHCLDRFPNATPAEIAATCGRPGGS